MAEGGSLESPVPPRDTRALPHGPLETARRCCQTQGCGLRVCCRWAGERFGLGGWNMQASAPLALVCVRTPWVGASP